MVHTNVEATNVDGSNLFIKQIYVNIITLTQKAKFHIEPIVALEDKVYRETYYHCKLGNIIINETTTEIKI
jgi:hypothetical protein